MPWLSGIEVKLVAIILTTLILRPVPVVSKGESSTTTGGVSWMVQVSDLHVSQFNKTPIEDDLISFAQQVLQRIRPAKIVLSGDLVDSKTKQGGSQQHQSEWQGYQRVWKRLASAAGLEAKDVLDIRGNHDVFDIIRGSSADMFMQYSARVATEPGAGRSRIYVDMVQPQAGGTGGGAGKQGESACPAAVLVGLDLTPDIGMRSPTNFMGIVTDESADEMERSLVLAVGSLRSKGCMPPIIAYSHHPLSTVTYPNQQPGAQLLLSMFAKYDVATFLCGHLHDAFGNRLHRLHQKRNGAFLAELETADWKHTRRFRVLTTDEATVTFADFRFLVSEDREVAEVVPIDESMKISTHMVLITSPPPTLYSPLTSVQIGAQYSVVRCLVLPVPRSLRLGEVVHRSPQLMFVMLHWRCGEQTGKVSMHKVGEQEERMLYEGDLEGGCAGDLELQVVATALQGEVSTSAWRTVSLNPNTDDSAAARNGHFSWMEQMILGVYWPEVGRQLFLSLWTFHLVAMLLLPRLLSHPIILVQSALKDGYSSSTPTAHSLSLPLLLLRLLFKVVLRLGRTVGCWTLWPLQALARMAMLRDLWLYTVAFNINLLIGPWFCARFTSNIPAGFLTSYGLYLPPSPPPALPQRPRLCPLHHGLRLRPRRPHHHQHPHDHMHPPRHTVASCRHLLLVRCSQHRQASLLQGAGAAAHGDTAAHPVAALQDPVPYAVHLRADGVADVTGDRMGHTPGHADAGAGQEEVDKEAH